MIERGHHDADTMTVVRLAAILCGASAQCCAIRIELTTTASAAAAQVYIKYHAAAESVSI